nr:hypothetical protein [uncultured Cohaesibacter sp.]
MDLHALKTVTPRFEKGMNCAIGKMIADAIQMHHATITNGDSFQTE